MKSRVRRIDPGFLRFTGARAEAFIRRAMKKFDEITRLRELPTSEAQVRVMELFGLNDITGLAAVLGALRYEDLDFSAYLRSVDKTQQKHKPGTLLAKLVRLEFKAVSAILREKANQPVQAMNPTTGMLFQ
eukprot:5109877-Pyramimonas_sp.AAC.1